MTIKRLALAAMRILTLAAGLGFSQELTVRRRPFPLPFIRRYSTRRQGVRRQGQLPGNRLRRRHCPDKEQDRRFRRQ